MRISSCTCEGRECEAWHHSLTGVSQNGQSQGKSTIILISFWSFGPFYVAEDNAPLGPIGNADGGTSFSIWQAGWADLTTQNGNGPSYALCVRCVYLEYILRSLVTRWTLSGTSALPGRTAECARDSHR